MFSWLLFIIIFLTIFLFFLRRPLTGLYFVIFFSPFIGLMIDFSQLKWLRQIPYLNGIQAPLADILVLILFSAILTKLIYYFIKNKKLPVSLFLSLQQTGFLYFLPFLIAGALSLINVPAEQINGSLKYLMRPIFFSFLMWVLLPYFLVDTKENLEKILKIILLTGILASFLAWFSLFKEMAFTSWHRLSPVSLFGLAPLTYNHNVLAEVLVTVIPLAFYFFTLTNLNNRKINKLLFFLFVFITITALLTFSRAAWIALLFEIIFYYWLKDKQILPSAVIKKTWKYFRQQVGLALLLLLPFIIYMVAFSFSSVVSSSNATRADMTGIAWAYFTEHPWLGNGVGTFMNLLADTRLFTVEYGDPLEAHGVIQKILAEEGLVGLITFFVFIGWLLKKLYGGIFEAKNLKARQLELMLFLAISGSLIFQLFNTSYYNSHLWLPLGLALTARKIYSYD